MQLRTRLTERLGLRHPIISAPMSLTTGGRLAAAVTAAGGLGLIGGGYGDTEFLTREFRAAGNQRVGCGFVTWSLARQPGLLDLSLAHRPAAVMLSFGDPAPFVPAIRAAGATLICQCQSIAHVREALAVGADIIVAQGAEAGGHGQSRGTLTLVPETADLLARQAPETLLVAAGGIADGRGLAAALLLGADGVLLGTRLWASSEALTHPNHQRAAIAASGDDTIRTTAVDIVRRLDWPEGFTIRVGRNGFTDRWHGREGELKEVVEVEAAAYTAAFAIGDAQGSVPVYGEAAGLIDSVEPAATIITRMVGEAAALLARRGPGLVSD